MTIGIGQIFSRGLDGLNVNQRGLAVASNNIANMNTKGYARQQVLIGTSGNDGGGAVVLGVTDVTSPFVELQLFNSANSLGLADGRRQTVGQVEELFNEAQTDGLGKAMTDFFNSWSALANDAGSTVNRQNVRDAGSRVVDRFNSMYGQLDDMRKNLGAEAAQRIATINSLSSQIAELNGSISGEGNPENVISLKGQRRELMRQLSEEVNITYFEQGDNMQISVNGSVSLVNNTLAGTFSMSDDISVGGTLSISVTLPGSTSAVDVTAQIDGGRLGGNLVERNTTLNDRMDDLDELAYNLGQRVNTAHAAGYSLDGTTGINFFSALGSQSGAARNLALDSQIDSNLRNIAAASQDPAVSGVADGGVAISLAQLQDSLAMTSGTKSFHQFYNELVGTVATTSKSVLRDFETQSNLANNLEIQRESISGVSMDEEGANIIRFQKAYQASSKLISVADSLMESIIGLLR